MNRVQPSSSVLQPSSVLPDNQSVLPTDNQSVLPDNKSVESLNKYNKSINTLFNGIVIVMCLLIIYCVVFLTAKHVYNSKKNIDIDLLPDTGIKYTDIRSDLRTGDLMLVRSDRNYSKTTAIIFNTIGGSWSHIGFIYVYNKVPYVITARGRNERFVMLKNYLNYETPPNVDPEHSIGYSFEGGITMHKLDDEMEWYKLAYIANGVKKAKIGFLTLRTNTPDYKTNLMIMTYLKLNPVKKYRASLVYLFGKVLDMCQVKIFNRFHSNDKQQTGVICSEITADLLKLMGIIKDTVDTRWIEPRDFELDKSMYVNEKIYNPPIICKY